MNNQWAAKCQRQILLHVQQEENIASCTCYAATFGLIVVGISFSDPKSKEASDCLLLNRLTVIYNTI